MEGSLLAHVTSQSERYVGAKVVGTVILFDANNGASSANVAFKISTGHWVVFARAGLFGKNIIHRIEDDEIIDALEKALANEGDE